MMGIERVKIAQKLYNAYTSTIRILINKESLKFVKEFMQAAKMCCVDVCAEPVFWKPNDLYEKRHKQN